MLDFPSGVPPYPRDRRARERKNYRFHHDHPVVLILDFITKRWALTALAGGNSAGDYGRVRTAFPGLQPRRGLRDLYRDDSRWFFVPITILALTLLLVLLKQAGRGIGSVYFPFRWSWPGPWGISTIGFAGTLVSLTSSVRSTWVSWTGRSSMWPICRSPAARCSWRFRFGRRSGENVPQRWFRRGANLPLLADRRRIRPEQAARGWPRMTIKPHRWPTSFRASGAPAGRSGRRGV